MFLTSSTDIPNSSEISSIEAGGSPVGGKSAARTADSNFPRVLTAAVTRSGVELGRLAGIARGGSKDFCGSRNSSRLGSTEETFLVTNFIAGRRFDLDFRGDDGSGLSVRSFR